MNHPQSLSLGCGRAIQASAEQPREREIPDLLGQLLGAAQSASTSLGMLIERIGPVMRAESPSATSGTGEAPAYTDLGSSLYDLLRRVRGLDALAHDALNRLELP